MGSLNSISFFIIFPIIIIYQFVLNVPFVGATDVLRPGDELNSTSTLVSALGNFTLGFFTIDPDTNFTYLGISYTGTLTYTNDLQKKIWVSNRDIPIPMNSNGSLIIDESGILKVVNRGGNNTNTTLFNVSNQVVVGSNNINTIVVLEESGNLVLYGDANRNRILWQSFDHPTDTILHGMKLGHNLTTGQNWIITSWSNDLVPGSGAFTLRFEQYQNIPQLVIYRRGEPYWSSGPWENFEGFMRQFGQKMSMISDDSGMSVSFEYYMTEFDNSSTVPTILQLSSMGYVLDALGPGSRLAVSSMICYGYKNNDGCAIFDLPTCRSQRDSFQQKRGGWGNQVDSTFYNYSSLSDCMEKCWNDCNCNGYMMYSNSTVCQIWSSGKKFFPSDLSEILIYVMVSEQLPKNKTWIWVLCVAIVLTLLLSASLCYVRIRRRRLEERIRNDYIHQLTGSSSFSNGDEFEKGIKDAPDVKIFSFKAILLATDNFSNKNKLGQGGYGPVYKGKLLDGRQIAVKRLSKTSGQGIEEFKSELILISKLQHKNLVRLYGCCIHQEEKMLIYEFMPNKSLDFFLFGDEKNETIDWRIRFNIIEGVAQGLLYLHKYSRMRVIHRDLKVSNILLDENMNPKIADFGMARIFQHNESEEITNRVVGTRGYMAPEYVMGGTFSIKSDVFSYGVLILEIISGRRNLSSYNLDRPLNLIGYAWELWKGEAALELKDETLDESCDIEELQKIIQVGLLCVQENADDRPTMSEVISMLNNEITNLSSPKQPAFFTGRQPIEIERKSTDYLLNKNNQVSLNGLTITMEAR